MELSRSNLKPLIILFLISSALALPGYAVGVNSTSWQAGIGDWSTASNWTSGEPGLSHTAYIDNGGAALITDNEMCDQLILANQTGTSGNVEMSAGSLTTNYQTIGAAGTGRFTQGNGANTVSAQLVLGGFSGAYGEYNIGGGILNAGVFLVGSNSTIFGDSEGVFSVMGDDADIVAYRYGQNYKSTLNSYIDPDGISLITVSDTVSLDGTWNVFDSTGNAPLGTFNIITAAGGITGAFDNVILPNTTEWSWGIDSGTTLWVQHVPEPATLMLLGLGGWMLRKRK